MSTVLTLQRSSPERPRILYLLQECPRTSETHITNEIAALEDRYDLMVAARCGPAQPASDHRPCRTARTLEQCVELIQEFQPQIIHTHYLTDLCFVGRLAEIAGLPFTVRTHWCDTVALRRFRLRDRMKLMLERTPPPGPWSWPAEAARAIESELCLGVLALPCSRPWLERAGIGAAKLIDCFPLVRFERFYDRSPNGEAVMNMSATSERPVPEFLHLAQKVRGSAFRLYASDRHSDWLRERNRSMGAGAEFVHPMRPDGMPGEYKKHRWLVYTGDFEAVGWPAAIAEAQASGVGICMPSLRPDLAEYVGRGAGVFYDTMDELTEIVARPVPDEMRERGFAQARKSDIDGHKHLLTDLWEAALGRGREADPLPAEIVPQREVANLTF
ncbi:MAG TPA: hypothetical protein VJQ77_05740 [Novosphingobium sp.]|nr:hypothetical protein [Novosphingobium sp.]